MTDLEELTLKDLRHLNELVQKQYTKALDAKGGATICKRQARWHRIGMKVMVAITRKKAVA